MKCTLSRDFYLKPHITIVFVISNPKKCSILFLFTSIRSANMKVEQPLMAYTLKMKHYTYDNDSVALELVLVVFPGFYVI